MTTLRRRLVPLLATALLGVVTIAPANPAVAVPPGAGPAVPLCGYADPTSMTQDPATVALPDPVTKEIFAGKPVSALVVRNGVVHVLSSAARTVTKVSVAGAALGSVTLPASAVGTSLAVGPDGALYIADLPYNLTKLSPTGQVLWSRSTSPKVSVRAVLAHGEGPAFRVALATMSGSTWYDADGNQTATNALTGNAYLAQADGGITLSDGKYVRVYDSSYQEVAAVGDKRSGNDSTADGLPDHFRFLGGALVLPSGDLLVADGGRELAVVSQEGHAQGYVSETLLGGFNERPWIGLAGDTLIYASGVPHSSNQSVRTTSLAAALAFADKPKWDDPRLGYGAGLEVGATTSYFRPGDTPVVNAVFDPVWSRYSGRLVLRYTVRDRAEAQSLAPTTWIDLPLSAASFTGPVALELPPTEPGFYEVDSRLVLDGEVISGTCAHYGVGAEGSQLDFSTLPGGANAGGADPERDVVLADYMGTGLSRTGVDWVFLMPNATGPLNFSKYDAQFAAGVAESERRGIPLVVQVGVGAAPEKTLVANGQWEARVRELVARYKGQVKYWEAWNEPNLTYGTPEAYTDKVLKPFYRGVKAGDPDAKVVGPSVVGLNIALNWFERIGAVGGLDYMDVASFHSYTGHNRSWEEEGATAIVKDIRTVLTRYGKGSMPMWDTEHAWWSNGYANYFEQGDFSVRKLLWMKEAGLERWAYFNAQSTWGPSGLSFGSIQGTEIAKPAMLAMMVADTRMRGRSYLGLDDDGDDFAHVMRFGSRGGEGELLALWGEDSTRSLAVSAATDATVTLHDAYGKKRTARLLAGVAQTLVVDGSVTWLTAPPGVQVTAVAAESFGANLALTSGGAVLTGSSETTKNLARSAGDGRARANGQGDFRSSGAWASASGDATPTLTVALPREEEINRVTVSTVGLGSVLPGLRNFHLDVRTANGGWQRVSTVTDQFVERVPTLRFDPVRAKEVRLTVTAVNFGGYLAGQKTYWWTTNPVELANSGLAWHGPAIVREIEVFGPGQVASSVALDSRSGPEVTATPEAPVVPAVPVVPVDPTPALPPGGSSLPVQTLVPLTGAQQVGRTAAPTPERLSATVGVPGYGRVVTFTVVDGTSTAAFAGRTSVAAVTDANGYVIAPVLTSGGRPGTYSVLAEVEGKKATFSVRTRRAEGTVIPVEPSRILDTRDGNGAPQRPLAAGGTLIVKVAGRGGVPTAGASAVVLNLTATGGKGNGFITAFPGGTRPVVSNLNLVRGSTRPNLVTVPVAPDGSIRLFNGTNGTVELLADVQAWVSDGAVEGGRHHAVTPTRLLDTREASRPVPAGGSVTVRVRGAVPGSEAATAAYLNLTAVGNGSGGYVTAHPTGIDLPLASNLNTHGQTVANLALVPVGEDGTVTLYNGTGAPLHLVADLQGFFTPAGGDGSRLLVTTPVRAFDSRTAKAQLGRAAQRVIPLAAANPDAVTPLGSRVTAVMSNLTVVAPTGGGFVSAYSGGSTPPVVSNVNLAAGEVLPNAAVVPVGAGGSITAYNGTVGSTDLLVDVQGWFVAD